MRTGSPPAPCTASAYCGSERSAYSRSPECGTGMAIRGAAVFASPIFNSPSLQPITSTHALNPSQSLPLPIIPNLHQEQQHQHDRAHCNREWERNVPVGECQVGRDMLLLRVHHSPENTEQ